MSLLEKASNSIVMFFAGVGVTLAIVLFIFAVIQIYKRCMKSPKESTDVSVETVKMQDQSLPEPAAGPSQNNQVYLFKNIISL